MSTDPLSCPALTATGANISPALCPHAVGQDAKSLIEQTCATCRPIVDSILSGVKDLHHKVGSLQKDAPSSAPTSGVVCPVTGSAGKCTRAEARIAPNELVAMKGIFELFDEVCFFHVCSMNLFGSLVHLR